MAINVKTKSKTKAKKQDKCSNCGATETPTFWDYDDDTMLCDSCHKNIGVRWQEEIDKDNTTSRKNDKSLSNIVSPGKFVFLTLVSFGLYEIVWFYRSWKFFKEKEDLDISPFWRSVFAIFFLTELFNKILEYAKKEGYTEGYSSGWRTFFWFMFNLSSRLPGAAWLICMFSFVPLLDPLNAMNYYLDKTEKNCQPRGWKWWHIVLIIFGIIWWALVIVGLMTPDPYPSYVLS